MADERSYFSRFTVKFVEITTAGVATAVSGYLVAHIGGYLSTATMAPATVPAALPASLQVAPTRQVAPMANDASGSMRGQPVSADAAERRLAQEPAVRSPTAQSARPAVNAAQGAPPVRKIVTTETSAVVTKPPDTKHDDTKHADTKHDDNAKHDDNTKHEMESVEAEVRAALAKAEANPPAPRDQPSHQVDIPAAVSSGPPAIAAQPQPQPDNFPVAAIPPRAAEVAPQPVAPPALPAPLATVEIPSRPVAGDAATPSPPGQEDAQSNQASDQASDQGSDQASIPNGVAELFDAFKKIPNMLRGDTPTSDAPRPPMPVGQ